MPVTSPVDGITLIEIPGSDPAAATEDLTTGTIQATHAYGDNGIYTATVCVIDDDHDSSADPATDGRTCDSFTVTASNLNPDVTLDTSEAITFVSGNTAFLGRVGVEQTHDATATDPGSDDITFQWRFLPDSFFEGNVDFNDGGSPDPTPSPDGTFPFTTEDDVSVPFPGLGSIECRWTSSMMNPVRGSMPREPILTRLPPKLGAVQSTSFRAGSLSADIAPLCSMPFRNSALDEGNPSPSRRMRFTCPKFGKNRNTMGSIVPRETTDDEIHTGTWGMRALMTPVCRLRVRELT